MTDDFQLFERRAKRSIKPAINIVPQHHSEGRFGITEPAFRICEVHKIQAFEFYWSPSTRKIGLKAADPAGLNSYRLTPHARGRGGVVSAGRFLDSISYSAPDRVLIEVHWNSAEHMFELEVPVEFLKPEKVERPKKIASANGAA